MVTTQSDMRAHDHVVLVNDSGDVQGLAAKEGVHTSHTPLHLAFSCYVLDSAGRLLVTRRALGKRAWPGVWTNSFCGHPRHGEPWAEAIDRHARVELRLEVRDVQCLLPDFRYRATDASGIVENEICPVFFAHAAGMPDPNPAEVMEHRWADVDQVHHLVAQMPWLVSPWMALQLPQIWDRLVPDRPA